MVISMAARQRETRHELEDGVVIAWDSSEPDEELRQKLIEIANRQIGGIAVSMGEAAESTQDPPVSPSRKRRKSSRRRRLAA
jgi:hypothetical protein